MLFATHAEVSTSTEEDYQPRSPGDEAAITNTQIDRLSYESGCRCEIVCTVDGVENIRATNDTTSLGRR